MATPLRIRFATLCRETRVLLDITQAQLAAAAGISRSMVAGIETERVNPTLDVVMRIGNALGLERELIGTRPVVIDPRPSGVVHSRCSGSVDRRLRSSGWLTRREVEIVHARSHGWIDILAFHPGRRTLIIVEIKTRLDDLGLAERQLAWYERSAREVAARFGWKPVIIATWLLLLHTDEVDDAIRRERATLAVGFPARAGDMRAMLLGTPHAGKRGVALIDPSSRRADWLIPTRSDGRRSPAPYRDYADAARRMGREGQRCHRG
jgi:transcriptional regulator with XRE-family HTH domain